jgi:hypothetical protein
VTSGAHVQFSPTDHALALVCERGEWRHIECNGQVLRYKSHGFEISVSITLWQTAAGWRAHAPYRDHAAYTITSPTSDSISSETSRPNA